MTTSRGARHAASIPVGGPRTLPVRATGLRVDDNGEPPHVLGKLELPVAADTKAGVLEVGPPPEIAEPPAAGGEKGPEEKRR